MENKQDIQFVDTSTERITSALLTGFENLTGKTVYPGSPERLFILWIAHILVQERVEVNKLAKMNLPRFSSGRFMDELAALFHNVSRNPAAPAQTQMRFTLSTILDYAQLVPKGTRVRIDEKIIFETTEDLYMEAGALTGEVKAVCQSIGESGNGFLPGQITQLVDIFAYYLSCENITATAGGAEQESDASLYKRMRESEDTYSTAGPKGGYEYWAKTASTNIVDVKANSPSPGQVDVYVLLNGGALPTDEILSLVQDKLNMDTVRPITDLVTVYPPDAVQYDIDVTYYMAGDSEQSASMIEEAIENAVEKYIVWQSANMGRDINPSKLISLLMSTGIKRADVRAPIFQALSDGSKASAAQVAILQNKRVLNGGIEDE